MSTKSKMVKAVKAVKTRMAVKALVKRPVDRKQIHPRKTNATKHAHPLASVKTTTPEAEVVITKTVKWSAAKMKQFRDRLQRLHDMTADTLGFLTGGGSKHSSDGMVSKVGGDGRHTGEDGSETFAQDLSLLQAGQKQDMLNKIVAAFRRLDLHTYGSCEECGGLIAEARLQVQPFATMCIKCQSASEANRPRAQGFRKSMVQVMEIEST